MTTIDGGENLATGSMATVCSALFPVSDLHRAAKGRRWVRALQRQIADVWIATTETDTGFDGHRMVAEAEVVAISAAFALTAARVIDQEVFHVEHGEAYLNAKRTDRQGQVVDGFVLIRNAEIHLPVILEPDADRVLSLHTRDGDQLFRVMPRWKPYAELPAEVRVVKKGKGPGTAERCHDAYKDAVEGESIIETLLDALAWFLSCDPSLARRDAAGELEGFPLPELWQHEYERRHPEWPRRSDFDSDLRAVAATHTPEGRFRAIRHRIVEDGAITAYCGYTRTSTGGSQFHEGPEQVRRDVAAGFPYFVDEIDGYLHADTNGSARVELSGGDLVVNGGPLFDLPLLPFGEDEDVWRFWAGLVREDAVKYVQQRKGN